MNAFTGPERGRRRSRMLLLWLTTLTHVAGAILILLTLCVFGASVARLAWIALQVGWNFWR